MYKSERATEKFNEWWEMFGDRRGLYKEFFEPKQWNGETPARVVSDMTLTIKYGATITPENYWAFREQLKIKSNEYKLPPFTNTNIYQNSRFANEHFLHVSEDKPGSMIAFTENAQKGREDRQMRMRIGKYLRRYFSDVLTDEDIRDYANEQEAEFGDKTIHFQPMDTIENILEVYLYGPTSCMSKRTSHYSAGGYHPLEAYIDSGLSIAYLKRGDRITGRTIVNPDNRKFVGKIYGDEELKSKLLDYGYEEDGDALSEVKLQRIDVNDGHVCPYIDGDNSCVDVYSDHLEIVYIGDYETHDGNVHEVGMVGNNTLCEVCDEHYSRSNMRWVDSEDQYVCESCIERDYLYAEDHGHTELVYEDDVIDVNGENYRNTDSNRDYYDIVVLASNEYEMGCNAINVNGWYYHEDDVVTDHNGDYQLESECVKLGGEYYHEDDVVTDYYGEYQPESKCVKLGGEYYHEDDVVTDHNGDYQPKSECVEFDGEYYHKSDPDLIDLNNETSKLMEAA